MKWQAKAPANIALIKYMGKVAGSANQASNPSLSYTLNHLVTTVELSPKIGHHDQWQPLPSPDKPPLTLSEQAMARFLHHAELIKTHFQFTGSFIIRSSNNFPADCGLASSASSYAALTRCLAQAICDLTKQPLPPISALAKLSRRGSGSSCRSFFSPWCLWDNDTVRPLALPYHDLIHQVIIVDKAKKTVSSSEAHQRVNTSHLYPTRQERAAQRLDAITTALSAQDWRGAFTTCWQEFWDMHALFETASPPFGYLDPCSVAVLRYLHGLWERSGDGPLVTMDAGPNVHLLYRPEQIDLAYAIKAHFTHQFPIIMNHDHA